MPRVLYAVAGAPARWPPLSSHGEVVHRVPVLVRRRGAADEVELGFAWAAAAALAIVPASLVSVLVSTAGLMFVRLTLLGTLGDVFTFINEEDWAALAPELLWPLWGAALAAATLAYYYRRRGWCVRCDRG